MPAVLIVDDEFGLAEMAGELLVMAGHTVTMAINGRLALAALDHTRPDIILLDVMMPIMSGIEMLQSIKRDVNYRMIPVIMMSAAGRESIGPAERALTVGFLQKPFTFDALVTALDAGLASLRSS